MMDRPADDAVLNGKIGGNGERFFHGFVYVFVFVLLFSTR